MKWLLVVLSLVVCCSGDTSPPPYFRCDYQYSDEAEGWLKVHSEPADWASAAMRCRLEGAALASPTTPDLRKAMLSHWASMNQSNVPMIYTGINALFSKYYFATFEGKPLSQLLLTWTDGAPFNFKENYDCIVMSTSDGRLDGSECATELPYICYRKKSRLKYKAECATTDLDYYYNSRSGSCYKFHYIARPWHVAYATCAAEDAHLAIVNSKDESEILSDLVDRFSPDDGHKPRWSKHYDKTSSAHKTSAFIGFKKVDSWMPLTVDGQTLKEAGFDKYDYRSEGDCGAVNDKGGLTNQDCQDHRPFICERRKATAECW